MTAIGQTPAARVTQPVDVEQLVTLQGNTHPLARPEFDQGVAPDSLPMQRILLVLQRSAEQNAALHELLEEQQTKSSPDYHMWLTPEQFGQQFGPGDADIQAVTDWLTSQGFEVNRVAAGRTVIEFSGTAGTVRQAFHTEIHKFLINGEEHWANASDPKIPAALQPVVAGFASLNNFPRRSLLRRRGPFSRNKATGVIKPLMTGPSYSGNYYAVGPTDFATIYNVLPLWQGSPTIDGTGQTIAIVAGSNINLQDIVDFRNLFGLPANTPHIIVNGDDPGVTMTDEETEADLDTEWSGAVAKNATIDLVVSEDTEASFGGDLSAVYIVDNNLAPILSASYGACEAYVGTGGNAFYNALWGQGAAQGITILVASGDGGSGLCGSTNTEPATNLGLAVNGVASTPFNVAVGGTDFNDVNNRSSYWSTTNNSTTLASALSYIPEMPWNDTCARTGTCVSAGSDTPTGIDMVGAGGGASNCVTSIINGTTPTCTGGYPKPAWQSGTGVPNDNARDLPDVSLFAADGTIASSFYVVCEADALPAGYASCNQNAAYWLFLPVGGTSASTPAFAGIMALVNQKTGERQGNANYVLYPLAAKNGASCASTASLVATAGNSACIFYDTVTGNNSVACQGGTPNCSNTTTGEYGLLEVNPPTNPTPAWTTTPGYDLATGLGSVNAANLVKNWSSVSFKPSKTTLSSLSPTTLTHGQSVAFTINVAPGSGSGTPTGAVSLIAQTGTSSTNVTGIGPFTLSGRTITSSTDMLPGGTYGVTAHYAGNGTYGASDSTPPIQVTVSQEGSQTHVALLTFDPTTGQGTNSNATSAPYGSMAILRADVTNSSGQDCFPASQYSCPTGQVALTDNGQSLDLGAYKLNSEGYAEDQYPQIATGSHKIVAAYSGDNSYNTSSSPSDTITITLAPTTVTTSNFGQPVLYATPAQTGAEVDTTSFGVAPTGTFTFFIDGAAVGGAVPLSESGTYNPNISPPLYAWADASSTVLFMSVGNHTLSAQYSGDSNYAAATSPPVSVLVTQALPTIGSWGANPATTPPNQQVTLMLQLWGSSAGVAPTGTVTFQVDTTTVSGTVTYTSSAHGLNATVPYTPTTIGTHTISAFYSGDVNYSPESTTGAATLTVVGPDFQVTGPSFNVPAPGASGSTVLTVAAENGFTGTINFTCDALQIPEASCSVKPTSIVTSGTVTVGLTTTAPSTIIPILKPWWFVAVSVVVLLCASLFLAIPRRRWPTRLAFGALSAALLTGILIGCGGGSSGTGGSGNQGTPAGAYTLSVTSTSGTITHTLNINVLIQ
jgi:hypothetical protein